ncbi:putative zinc-binding domain-containing protein [Hyaloraphidium curvatum]|nr:putative zinc-binding domain-containing protein [Hyaloraphidium curvatum]
MSKHKANCKDCGESFVFTAGEKAFFESKGFDNKPTRCKSCKDAKKAKFNEGGRGGARGGRGGRGGFTRGGRGGSPGGGGGNVCYAFQKGECTRGDSCRFSHEGGGGGGGFNSRGRGRGGARGGRGGRGAAGGGGGGVCYAFQKGECTRGDSCRFSHA